MKTKFRLLLLTTLFAATTLPLWAEAPAVLGVDALAAKPAEYTGKPLHLTGIVHRVSAERRMIVLIDLSEANCTDACSPATVIVQLGEKGDVPTTKEAILVMGRIAEEGSPVTIEATKWVPAKEFKPAE